VKNDSIAYRAKNRIKDPAKNLYIISIACTHNIILGTLRAIKMRAEILHFDGYNALIHPICLTSSTA
jgi:hypothetical protein